MAITLRGQAKPFANGGTGTSASLSSTAIAGLATGDVVVAGFYIDTNNVSITPPSGWTLIDNLNQSAGPFNQATFYHVVTASEPANWTWTLGSSVFWDAELIAFTGCNTTTPLDAHNVQTGNVAASLTYAGADAVILFSINYAGANVAATGFTFVENSDGLGLGYVIESASGSTGSVTVTGGGGSASTVSLIALSPAGGGGSIVSGSATLQANAALVENAAQIRIPATLPSTLQANAAVAEAARIVAALAQMQGNAVLAASPSILGQSGHYSIGLCATSTTPAQGSIALADRAANSVALTAVGSGLVSLTDSSIGRVSPTNAATGTATLTDQ